MLKQPNRLSVIDPARFVAALCVMVFHYAFRGYRADGMTRFGVSALEHVAAYGYLGVHLFFVISGFVIGMTARKSNLRSFVVSRVSRLYPAFWVGCTLTFVVVWLLQDPRFLVSFPVYVANLSMLVGFTQLPRVQGVPYVDGVYWSLTEELRFYAIVLVALWVLQRAPAWLPKRNVALWGLSLWLLLGTLSLWRNPAMFDFLFAPRWAGYFSFGVLCFLLFEGRRGLWVWLALGWSFFLMLGHAHNEMLSVGKHYGYAYQFPVVVLVLGVVAVFFVLIGLRRLSDIPNPKLGLALGAMTYPIYLIHQHIGFAVLNRFYNGQVPFLWMLGLMLVVIGLAHLIAQHLEKPLMLWLRAWLRRLPFLAQRAT